MDPALHDHLTETHPASSPASSTSHAADVPTGNDPAPPSGPGTTGAAPYPAQLLFTPGQAAAVLQVRESWLRRRAAARQVPCTFLGKHLRFSQADLEKIAADAAQPARPHPAPGSAQRRHRRPHPTTVDRSCRH